jgi:hypothetical protein
LNTCCLKAGAHFFAATGDNMSTTTRLAVAAIMVAATVGCVTINIYFPAAAAERAADRIIDEVWQLREGATRTPGSGETATGEPK